ncbi:MAG TPA: radical SAM family heme chaperone HemW [Candidatus Marinimicrobia bacterium]|nr:radical SAM family heme chaperone HemW [Candidatus Neomarinimicrobiota bacterium]HRS51257.1 radical SAM family heme chaperone HemW [Candidatus Neomarinimicrobiota bacterium]HRU91505.1 radical SAM family heme chaperone HemW [Candidatus Neomarinimicrobiota bacterium]
MTKERKCPNCDSVPEELGLYLHFPFCLRKCRYCDFPSEDQGLERIPAYTEALVKEITLRAVQQAEQTALQTIYFGGGTPNLFGTKNFRRVIQAIREYYLTEDVDEFTVEINPGALTADFLESLKAEGVNRLSLGAQSFNDDELYTLGRIHSSREIDISVKELKQAGFSNFSLDFIYGIPGQTLASWQETLEKALQTGALHLSLYCLSYEKGTPLYRAQMNGEIQAIDDELEWQMYQTADNLLVKAGFRHYEISNFAKPGFEAQHNSIYWKGGRYLGLGAAAHSYDGKKRWWNERLVNNYIQALQNNRLPIAGQEELSPSDRIIETVFLGLRTVEGLDIMQLEKLTGIEFSSIYDKLVEEIGGNSAQVLTLQNGHLILTARGWFLCDLIIEKILTIIEEIKNDNPKSKRSASGTSHGDRR